ncbi:MAG: Asp-tRNA(Asn)/Glu-tRNA(Gln) amidotransferase subunit GatB [Alphaproteobacteria bacterium]|nr:MAG: Asp-tRNA(Asn)/Glu-tRNA(Gln) amidotransferase subunit GatB [Alphaproteobacteria bacterium]
MPTENNYIRGETGNWEVIIGLEMHAQITSNSKLFSRSSAEFGGEPNDHVAFLDAGMPGQLPVINEKCVEQAVRTGLGLQAQINLTSLFDRKNYFYPDLPTGYQISQFFKPIVGKGEITIDLDSGSKKIGITRLHMEQDAGKSIHDQHPTKSFIDLNRAGVGLMEIVSEPDMRSAEEAGAYVKKMRAILRYLGTCDGNMEEGSLRCDVNVSVRKPGGPLGTRCEIKNVNSVRYVMEAIEVESRRQIEIIEGGGKIDQETRLFDPNTSTTRAMRSKEDAQDYRYFPCPDLPPLILTPQYVEKIKSTLPELPDQKKQRYMTEYNLSAYDASVLVGEKEVADYYDTMLKILTAARQSRSREEIFSDAKMASNWLTVELFGALNKDNKTVTDSPIAAKQLAGLLLLILDNTISGKIAKEVFAEMLSSGKDAADIVESKGLKQVTDVGAIEKAIDDVLAANADKVAEYKAGKDKMFGFFVGQVMKSTGGKANPNLLNEILKKKLGQ